MPSTPASAERPPVLEVAGLTVTFSSPGGRVAALDGVGLAVAGGERLGIVGESGCGKTQLLLAVMGLTSGSGRAAGSVRLEGEEILGAPRRRLDALRGDRMAMIFQDPLAALNPTMTVGAQLTEVLARHRGVRGAAARRRAVEMLERVRLPAAATRLRAYPHELSGGMRQRVMIAMALICEPALILADEPTTALDVTIAAQIVDLLDDVSRHPGTSIVLVTHDLGVTAQLCDRVIVLYGGRVVEAGPTGDLLAHPRHPYTRGLIGATPTLEDDPEAPLAAIPGQPPAPAAHRPGCPFAPRCPLRLARCEDEMPALVAAGAGTVACHAAGP